MKKLINNLNKEKVQRGAFLGLVVLVFAVFMLSLFIGSSTDEQNPPVDEGQNPPINNNNNNNNNNNENKEPEQKEPEKYKAPCDTLNTNIIRHFYSLDDDPATQEMSLIQMGTRYQTSKGLTYKNDDDKTFDVTATLSGTVTKVEESALYGNIITIDHGNNVKSEYLGVSNVLVKVGDAVSQGAVIASSGQADYDVASSNHVHFRVSIDGKYVDPENVIGTTLEKK